MSGADLRNVDPPGGSSITTSAPIDASRRPAYAAATVRERSTTRQPASGSTPCFDSWDCIAFSKRSANDRQLEVAVGTVEESGQLHVARRQRNRGDAGGGDFIALVLGGDLDVHQGRLVLDVLAHDLALAERRVAHDV